MLDNVSPMVQLVVCRLHYMNISLWVPSCSFWHRFDAVPAGRPTSLVWWLTYRVFVWHWNTVKKDQRSKCIPCLFRDQQLSRFFCKPSQTSELPRTNARNKPWHLGTDKNVECGFCGIGFVVNFLTQKCYKHWSFVSDVNNLYPRLCLYGNVC